MATTLGQAGACTWLARQPVAGGGRYDSRGLNVSLAGELPGVGAASTGWTNGSSRRTR